EYVARFPQHQAELLAFLSPVQEGIAGAAKPAPRESSQELFSLPTPPPDTAGTDIVAAPDLASLPPTGPLPAGDAAADLHTPAAARYRLLRLHAKGGWGEVHLAEDGELYRRVAFKCIQARYADQTESRRRFLLEAEITGNLEHPGIVPVYGLGRFADGRPF